MRLIQSVWRSRAGLISGRAGALVCAAMLLGCSDGCKKSVNTPPVVTAPAFFRPAQQTQNNLVATVTVSDVEGTLGKVGTLSGKLGLPFGTEQLRQMLIAQAGLPPSLLAHLDLAKPIGSAFIGREKDKSPFFAVAAQAKSAQEAAAFLKEMGTKLGEDKGAVHIKAKDGSESWIFALGAVLIASDSVDGLQAAGTQAMAARTSKADDVISTLYPQAMALSQGTDLRTALTNGRTSLLAQMREQATRTPSPMPPEVTEKMLTAFFDPYIEDLVNTQSVDIALDVDASVGLKFLGRIHPIAGSAFAKSLGDVRPYEVDPAITGGPLQAGFFAVRYSDTALKRYADAMGALSDVNLPGMKNLAVGAQKLMTALTGGYCGTFNFDGGMNYSFIAPLAAGTDPGAVMDAADMALGPTGLGLLMKEAAKSQPKDSKAKMPSFVWKRQGSKARLEVPLTMGMNSKEEKQVQMLFGANKLSYLLAVTSNKLFGLAGNKSDAELARLSSTTTSTTDPDVQQVLNETKGKEGFVYLDLFQILRPMLANMAKSEPSLAQANAMLAFIPGADKLRVPMLFSYGGGQAFTGEWFIPLRAFQNVATIVRPLMGMGMGGGGAVAPGAQ
ncbi:MAG: hypothetical protein SF187_15980 [Deltaproteobacteria bacterium]|nr:hypothetical protein [Deltaproteobacteria bacterium]